MRRLRPRDRADATTQDRATAPDAPPWIHAADIVCLGIVVLSVIVAVTGGFRLNLGGVPLSVRSPGRLFLWALAIAAVRHVVYRRPTMHENLLRRFARWQATSGAWLFTPDLPAHRADASTRGRIAFAFATAAFFALITCSMTAPLARHVRDAVHDPGDPLLNLWTIDWVAHQLKSDPLHLFDGNIFFPERWTLAYSETLLAPSAVAAPLLWTGASRILIYNLVFLAGFALSGVGAALLVRRLTGSAAAAIVAGVIFAFCPFRFDHYPQLQLQQAQWIPLAFWAYHRLIDRGRASDGALLGVFVACQLLSCMYYGIYLASYFVVVGSALLLACAAFDRTRLRAIALAIVVAVALFAPAGNAYLHARTVVGERETTEIATRSATWSHYLAAPKTNRLFGWTAARFGAEERNLYPGVVAVALSITALWPPVSAVRLAYGLGLAWAITLTFGLNAPVYGALYRYVPLFRALRIPALAVVLVGFSLAVLAGFGFERLSRRFARRRVTWTLAAVVCAAILAESWPQPMHLWPAPNEPPPIYADLVADLRSSPPVPIVEIPMIVGGDQTYMYYSTFHRQQLLNGYSGFFPESYLQLAGVIRGFPDARSLHALRARGARYALVHGEFLEPGDYAAITKAVEACQCGVTVLARRPWADREISLYRLGQ